MNPTEDPGISNTTWGPELIEVADFSSGANESWNWIVALIIVIVFAATIVSIFVVRLLYQKVVNRRAREEAAKRTAEGY
ncbi:unnamed protein product [Cylicocyclus nassatus]|uniref:Uncharacterized protein n=1 Tax=Cylicocyclus nassatus TaxID=53992 RepID=A0AA36GK07_CYLNA|nr:unnamed protein product [Cylicocyclus nassatus]